MRKWGGAGVGGHFAPELADFEHVGLVHGAQLAVALHGELERVHGNSLHLGVGVDHRVEGAPLAAVGRVKPLRMQVPVWHATWPRLLRCVLSAPRHAQGCDSARRLRRDAEETTGVLSIALCPEGCGSPGLQSCSRSENV